MRVEHNSHLYGALQLQAYKQQKLCLHLTVAFVLDVPGSHMYIGTFKGATDEMAAAYGPGACQVPHIHAWAEWRGCVYAPTTLDKSNGVFQAMNPKDYYEAHGATDIKILRRPEILKLSKKHNISGHFLKGQKLRSKQDFGIVILDAAGKKYKVDDKLIVYPAE